MKKYKTVDIYCSVCGRYVGKYDVGQQQNLLQDAISAENVSFIILTQAKQRLMTFQNVIAAAE